MAALADLVGKEVKVWVGVLLWGYPARGRVKQYLPDYPGGPAYEVEFAPDNDPPFACFKVEWCFPLDDAPQE